MPAARRKPASRADLPLEANLLIDGEIASVPVARLFDDIPTVVFFIKDRHGRYLHVNRTLATRCGARDPHELRGRMAADLFPATLARHYREQDERVMRDGRPVLNSLDLHFYPDRRRGWCLTSKYPIRSQRSGSIAGVAGISRDLETSPGSQSSRDFPEVARALDYLHTHTGEPVTTDDLADASGLTASQLSARIQRIFGTTPQRLILRTRIDYAMHLLAGTEESLASIALTCGFCDQSAFTRHFTRAAGMPPGAFRTRSALTSASPGNHPEQA
jgi:AraC-like DNA-binding protein